MKVLRYSKSIGALVLTTALMLPLLSAGAQELTKEYNKEYNVDETVTIALNNRYGNVSIETWNENRVEIFIKVIVDMPETQRPERILDMISVEFHESDNSVGAKTILDSRFSSAVRGINPKFTIEYFVKVPAANNLDIQNRYGNISLGEHSGQISIDLRYGDLFAVNLSRGNERPVNFISLQYGDATIEEVNWLSLRARYSKSLNIGRAQALLIDSRYSAIRIDETGSLVADTQYDEYRITTINNLIAEGSYTNYRTGTIANRLGLKARYGSFTAANVPDGFEKIDIEASYCNITLPIDASATYRINARVEYSTLRYCEECITIETSRNDSRYREITGIAGNGDNITATVDISSKHGFVRLR